MAQRWLHSREDNVTHLVQCRLVNEPFSDPGLYVDFRFGRRAILFDLGDLAPLSAREIVRVGQVFVSHMHMDHFAGFDRLLRLNLYQNRTLHLYGPPGLGDAVESKLRAYTWNLLDANSVDFAIVVADWSGEFLQASRFCAREAFRREVCERPALAPGILVDEPGLFVEGAVLDHGIPTLAFALQERVRVNVVKSRLDALGLPVGPWLTEAKRYARQGSVDGVSLDVDGGRAVALADLLRAGALVLGPGQRVVYATDLAFHSDNVGRLVALARNADQLFIEAGFLHEDRVAAMGKRHLTAVQAGAIARRAGVVRATPFHFSPRYLDREAALQAEFAAGQANDVDQPEETALPLAH